MDEEVLNPFMLTATSGGGALACSVHVILRERLWEQAARKGEYPIPRRMAGCFPLEDTLKYVSRSL